MTFCLAAGRLVILVGFVGGEDDLPIAMYRSDTRSQPTCREISKCGKRRFTFHTQIGVRSLLASPFALVAAVTFYAQNPDRRAELASQLALDRIRSLIAADPGGRDVLAATAAVVRRPIDPRRSPYDERRPEQLVCVGRDRVAVTCGARMGRPIIIPGRVRRPGQQPRGRAASWRVLPLARGGRVARPLASFA